MLLRFDFYAFLLKPIVVIIVIVIWSMSLGWKKIWGDFLARSNILNSLTRHLHTISLSNYTSIIASLPHLRRHNFIPSIYEL
ncbi:hypothetical protein GIB67_037920 [Kingdonia uniflora]|uniref:Uncharacterized protein n=1 Tax=Kingdonia uniflora TaxID=39325 RepID=A0A7J7LH95_9MAGN|nr:hypothetical protein GIB67_037920 [Kingdonia uniflora]